MNCSAGRERGHLKVSMIDFQLSMQAKRRHEGEQQVTEGSCTRLKANYLFHTGIEQLTKKGHDSGLLAGSGGAIEKQMREIPCSGLG